MIFLPILNNITLVVTLSVAYVLVGRYFDQSSKRIQILNGVLFGSFIILGMYNSIESEPGLIFDMRSVILSVAGLFGGPIVGIIAGAIALSYRVWLGGSGVLMGVLVIVESVALGIFFHYFIRRKPKISVYLQYFFMGFLVHVFMLASIFALPEDIHSTAFRNILFPVLVLYPVVSFLVCVLFHNQMRYFNQVKDLSESEGRFKQFFNENHMVFLIIDPDTTQIRNVNKAASRYYGYAIDDLLSMNVSQINMLTQSELAFRISLSLENLQNRFVMQHKLASGDVRDVEVFTGPVDYDGKTHLYSIVCDITDRLKLENKLKQSEQTYRELFNVSNDVILLLDIQGNIVTYNKVFARYYGSKTDFTNENFFSVLSTNEMGEIEKYFQNVIESRKPMSFEGFSYEKNWWITFYPILKEKANFERIAVYAQDITLQRRLFNLQKNLHVAEKSAQLKQHFLSNMSHEMRTPMNGIIGMAELMALTPLTDTQKDYLTTIRDSSSSLLSLINDILALSNFDSGKIPLYLTNISLKELENKIISFFREDAIAKGINFEIDITSELPENIVCDEKRLTQVLVNIIGNALKFTPKGFVKVKGEPVKKKNAGNRLIKFTVEDSGIGIDADFISQIFDEFAQLDNSKTRKYEGSGLGLAISKRIVELLRGEIGVDSVKGKGSKFWFTIKSGKANEAGKVKKESDPYQYEPLGLNVLMVEDKIINRKVASLILKNLGCHTDMAENGLIGVDMAMKNNYDVVLMDIQMPVMDGITAVKAIRKSSIKQQPVIIGLSAEAMEGAAEKYIEMGMNDYITKPILPAVLYEKLSEIKYEKKG